MSNAFQSSRVGNFSIRSLKSSFSSTTSFQKHPLKNNTDNEWSRYEQLVRKLYMTNLFNPVKLGLENMDRLHALLGRPMDQVSFTS
jgi:dihydrofolate synthase/folylpolyglutamate synthase